MLTKIANGEYLDLTTITSMAVQVPMRLHEDPDEADVIIRHGTHGMFDNQSMIIPFGHRKFAQEYLDRLAFQANAESIEQANRPTANAGKVRDVLLEIVREFGAAGLLPKE
jgi:hypothetical protein